jgi:hypothetical protein
LSPAASKPRRPRKLAQTDREWQQLLRDKRVAVVRTKADWQRLLRSSGNPLAGLDRAQVDEFTKSLIFRNGGLAGANFAPVAGLSYRRFTGLWGRFGLGMGLFEDHKDQKCVPPCEAGLDHICLSNC